MSKQKPSPMSEAILWHLYRRLLGEHLFAMRLAQTGNRASSRRHRFGIGAALTENLLTGDTLGLAPGDLATRYLCGVPLEQLREVAHSIRRAGQGKRRSDSWWLAADADHGLLPGADEEQARLAVGTALAARLHQSGGITVLLESDTAAAAAGKVRSKTAESSSSAWAHAAETAVAMQLPLLFIAHSPAAPLSRPKRQMPAFPSIPVDRSDALALYRVIYESAARARSGGGPTWIECSAWSPPGTASRQPEESALAKMEEALRLRKLLDRQHQRQVQQSLEREFAQAGWELDGES